MTIVLYSKGTCLPVAFLFLLFFLSAHVEHQFVFDGQTHLSSQNGSSCIVAAAAAAAAAAATTTEALDTSK